MIDGIPILLDPEQSVFDRPAGGRAETAGEARAAGGLPHGCPTEPSLADRVKARLPSLGTNRQAARNYLRCADLLLSTPARPKVLVLGGARLGAGLKAIVDIASIEFVESDVYLGPRTSLVCDAHWIPFEDGSFDGVIAQAVIEHVADPAACAAEIHRVLKPRGLIYADTPFMQQVHAGAHDFTRFTHLGQRRLFRKFDEVSSGPTCGPGMALAWAYQYFLLSFVRGPRARAAAIAFARLTAFWLAAGDFDAHMRSCRYRRCDGREIRLSHEPRPLFQGMVLDQAIARQGLARLCGAPSAPNRLALSQFGPVGLSETRRNTTRFPNRECTAARSPRPDKTRTSHAVPAGVPGDPAG